MAATSLTLTYEAVLSTSFMNAKKLVADAVATSNNLLFTIMKKEKGGYKLIDDIGERYQCPIMTTLGTFRTVGKYDVLPTSPIEGITSAFWEWRRYAVAITIDNLEIKQNAGESKIVDLLDTKIKQAISTIKEGFNKSFLQGNGINTATDVKTAYTDPTNASSGVVPLGALVDVDPTTTLTVGGITQQTASNAWWRNQRLTTANTNYASFLKNLRQLRNDCSKGPGGPPNFHLCDQNTFQLYEAALAANHRNPSYTRGDLPFHALGFYDDPVSWDEFVINANGGTTVQSTTSGTWYMLLTDTIGFAVHSGTNFSTRPFVEPDDQDARLSQALWLGASWTNNRRKNGVLANQDTTVSS